MPIRTAPLDPLLRPVYLSARAPYGELDFFDAHTHIGHNDPDGLTATTAEIVEGMDAAGTRRALLFSLHEPGGYETANDTVLAARDAHPDRLHVLGRVDPKAPGAVAEARRCLDAGAAGIKLHPRSDAFSLPHPVVEEVAALVGERRGILLFHAGRGIPRLGEAAVALAEQNPGAAIVLAHAGISDLGHLAEPAARLGNLYFDTSWWQVSDLLTLVTTIPPARILYASDMPYGSGLIASFHLLRCLRAVGHEEDVVAAVCGGTLSRLVEGEPPPDLGPAPGLAALGPRDPRLERIVSHATAAVQTAFREGDPTEAIALARLGCQHAPDDPQAALLEAVDALLVQAEEHRALAGGEARAIAPATMLAATLAGTPTAGVPETAV